MTTDHSHQPDDTDLLMQLARANGPVGLWALELPRLRVTWSDEMCAIHGAEPGFRPSVDQVMEYVAPEDRQRLQQAIEACALRRLPFDLELRAVTASRSLGWIRIVGHLQCRQDGSALRVRGASQDITKLKQVDHAMRSLGQDLQQSVTAGPAEPQASSLAMESVGFAIAHELRSPIVALGAFAHVLLETECSKLSPDGQALLGQIRAASQQLNVMTGSLLELASLQCAPLRRQPLDLEPLARTIIDSLRAAEPDRDVEFRVRGNLRTSADRVLLRQVLANLLGNAWKFTRRAHSARITLDAIDAPAGQRVFRVRDNGTGFDMRRVDRLFQPFCRLHAQHEFEGTGIGLATVRNIVALHGGRIWADSRVGAGATFSFTLGPDCSR